jgi:uncharacterized protein YciI
MFFVQLKFSANKAQAAQHMEGHKAWLARGFADGVFVLAGSLQPQAGGAILAHDTSLQALQERVNGDPFVTEDVVTAEIVEVSPSKVDSRLDFLLTQA